MFFALPPSFLFTSARDVHDIADRRLRLRDPPPARDGSTPAMLALPSSAVCAARVLAHHRAAMEMEIANADADAADVDAFAASPPAFDFANRWLLADDAARDAEAKATAAAATSSVEARDERDAPPWERRGDADEGVAHAENDDDEASLQRLAEAFCSAVPPPPGMAARGAAAAAGPAPVPSLVAARGAARGAARSAGVLFSIAVTHISGRRAVLAISDDLGACAGDDDTGAQGGRPTSEFFGRGDDARPSSTAEVDPCLALVRALWAREGWAADPDLEARVAAAVRLRQREALATPGRRHWARWLWPLCVMMDGRSAVSP